MNTVEQNSSDNEPDNVIVDFQTEQCGQWNSTLLCYKTRLTEMLQWWHNYNQQKIFANFTRYNFKMGKSG